MMSGPDRLYINQKVGSYTPLVAKIFDQYGVSSSYVTGSSFWDQHFN